MSKIKRFKNYNSFLSENTYDIDNVEEFISNENESDIEDNDTIDKEFNTGEDTSKIDDTDLSDIGKIEEEEEKVKGGDKESKDDNKKDSGKSSVPKSGVNKVVKDDDGNTTQYDVKGNKVKEEEEIQDFSNYNNDYDLNTSDCKILIINSSEENDELDSTTERMKESLGCDCDEIHLYQLNIKDSKSEKEPKDGMEFIYNKLNECDGLVFAFDSINDNLKIVLKRLKKYYKEGELKNKILGVATDKNIDVTDIILSAMELGMILCGDCFCDIKDTTSTETTSCAKAMKILCDSTKSLRNESKEGDEIKDFDSYENSDGDYVEDVYDEESGSDDLSDLKKEVTDELAIPFEEDDLKTEEEEERLIDNLDGSITHIHGDDKDSNPKYKVKNDEDKNISEEEQSLPFSSFNRKDMWDEYKESNTDKTFDEFLSEKNKEKNTINEYNYDEWENVEEDEEDYEPMDFDSYLNSDELYDDYSDGINVGDTVTISKYDGSDPYNKKGETGEIIKIDGDTAVIYFENGDVGKYKLNTLQP